MNVLLLTSHSIAEYDDLRMLTDLGYDVFSIGGAYAEVPFEGKRPALDVPRYPEFQELCNRQRQRDEPPGPRIDWAKADLHDDIIDWADAIIVHHFPEMWIGGQWERIRHRRVIWRTCGQSDPRLEMRMAELHRDGMQVVRYSPAEKRAFQPLGMWAGEDALIRFGKYPDDYGPNTGEVEAVGNITQNMAQRGEACGYDRWLSATKGLPTQPAGPGSEALGGLGELTYDEMLDYLRRIRVYLYTGTQPASYTLGLIEAMLSGVPVVPISWTVPSLDWQWLGHLWEAHDILQTGIDPAAVRAKLDATLWDPFMARLHGDEARARAIDLFSIETVGPQWKAFLG
jgi:hypothetical protein